MRELASAHDLCHLRRLHDCSRFSEHRNSEHFHACQTFAERMIGEFTSVNGCTLLSDECAPCVVMANESDRST